MTNTTLTRRALAGGCLTLAAPAIVKASPLRPPLVLPTPRRLINLETEDDAQPFFSAGFGPHYTFVATPNGFSGSTPVWKSTSGNGEINYYLGDEQEYYQGSESAYNPFSLQNGKLSMTASKTPTRSNPAGQPYTSGMINTCTLPGGSFTGARIDVSAQLPKGPGLWPAIWLVPMNNQWPPEIDIMEMLGEDPTTIYCSLHWGPNGNDSSQYKYTQPVSVPDTSAGLHKYGLDFDSTVENSQITFFFDNAPVYRATLPSRMNGQTWFLMINLGVGGPNSWGGAPTAKTVFPASMLVNYVRMYPPGTILT